MILKNTSDNCDKSIIRFRILNSSFIQDISLHFVCTLFFIFDVNKKKILLDVCFKLNDFIKLIRDRIKRVSKTKESGS